MSIERQLRQAYDRAASSEPSEAGAYDRFLRRRARRDRAVAIATSIAVVVVVVVVVVLAAAALVPRVLAERQPTADRPHHRCCRGRAGAARPHRRASLTPPRRPNRAGPADRPGHGRPGGLDRPSAPRALPVTGAS